MLVTAWGLAEVRATQDVTRDGLMDVVMAFVHANERADLDLTLRAFDEDATVFLPGEPPQRVIGQLAIREAYRRTYGRQTGAISVSLGDVNVQRFGDAAVVTAHLGAVPVRPVAEPTTFATVVLDRKRARWLMVHLHASNVLLSAPK
jgi:ketosteroid isomerase-like protein